MKKHYLLFVLGWLLALTTTLAQPLREGLGQIEPPALRARKVMAPFVGVTVNIPLWKVLGRKKAKGLPKAPKLESEQSIVEELKWPNSGRLYERNSGLDVATTVVGKPSKKAKKQFISESFSAMNTGNEQTDECHCTDWYIVTTEHGTGRVVSEEYVGTTCTGGCEGTGGGGDGGGGGGGGGEEPNQYTPSIEELDCNAYQNFFQKSIDANKEQGALITADGKIVTLPMYDNTHTTVSWKNNYENQNGDRTVRIKQQTDGTWQVIIFDPADPFGNPPVYVGEIIAMIHTHPTLPNNDAGTYLPSSNDMNVAAQYPGLRQFVQYETGTFEFDTNGPVQCNSLPNCSTP